MMELVFLACFGTGPATLCLDKSLALTEPSTMASLMEAQPQLAVWVEEHPGWAIRRWACQPQGAPRRT
jgi:hypothetical protein